MIFQKALAFIKRDFYTEISYRFSFFLRIFDILFWILIFYFVAKLFGKAAAPYLRTYGGDYFSFVLIGLAFYGFLSTGLSTFANAIRSEQMLGTLESMLLTPTKLSTIILAPSLWSFIYASIEVLIYLSMGGLLFGIDFSRGNFLAAFIVLVLTTLCFSGLGIISASFIMVFKRGTPVAWVFSTGSALFGGVYFPITVLPVWLRSLSWLLPITYSLRAMRHALLQGYSFSALSLDILVLAAFAAVILPISIATFRYAVRQAKIKGTLAYY